MNVLPAGLGGVNLYGWRLDASARASTWDSGIGAQLLGGRWNNKGAKAVYASIDPAAAILEVAVHKSFRRMDQEPHILTCFEVLDPSNVHIVNPNALPNPAWLHPGTPSQGQKDHGDQLLAQHPFVLMPSAVSVHSWNILFNPDVAAGLYKVVNQERFSLDTRLNPPA